MMTLWYFKNPAKGTKWENHYKKNQKVHVLTKAKVVPSKPFGVLDFTRDYFIAYEQKLIMCLLLRHSF